MKFLIVLTILFLSINLFSQEDKILYQAQKFKYILETVDKFYADSVDLNDLCDKTFSFMLKSLDKQSGYYSTEEYKKIKEGYTGTNFGVGLEIVKLGDTLYIYDVHKNSPADSAGINKGDKILFINGENTKELNKNEANNKILGDTNTYVDLIIKRGYSSNLTQYKLKRKQIELPSVTSSFMIDGTDIGYIAYTRFSEISDTEFIEIAKELLNKGMKKLLLDLRGNPGGYLNKAGVIADQFISGDRTITFTQARTPDNNVKLNSKNGDILEGMPIIVLIDKNSASGSEIIAGAIQDYDLGLVVGETSFGKGSVQKFWNINDGSAFRITVGKYLTPLGRSIEKNIDTTQKLLDPSLELSQNKETLNKLQDIINKTGGRTHIPIFQTAKGRTVFGAGGIIPDVFINSDTLTMLTSYLKSRGIFLQWAFDYLANNSNMLKVTFGENSKKFLAEWQISNDMLKEFVNLAVSKKVWNDSMFVKDKKYIINYMKATIASLFYGQNEFFRLLLNFDKQAQEAILRFNDAEKLLHN